MPVVLLKWSLIGPEDQYQQGNVTIEMECQILFCRDLCELNGSVVFNCKAAGALYVAASPQLVEMGRTRDQEFKSVHSIHLKLTTLGLNALLHRHRIGVTFSYVNPLCRTPPSVFLPWASLPLPDDLYSQCIRWGCCQMCILRHTVQWSIYGHTNVILPLCQYSFFVVNFSVTMAFMAKQCLLPSRIQLLATSRYE